jgi:putative ABC transport system permease protein
MGVMSLGKSPEFHVIMSKNAFAAMVKGNEKAVSKGIYTEIYLNSLNPLKLQEELEQLQNNYGYSSMNIFNKFQYKQQETQSLLLVSVFTYAFIILITAICIANIINTISTSIALRKREFAMLKSIGITPKGFDRLLRYESIFYGIKALVYGLPVSILIMYLLYHLLSMEFQYRFTVSIGSILTVIAAVFAIVGASMLYSSRKVKKENIIDALKQEAI